MSLKGKDFYKMLNYEGVLIVFVEVSRRFHLLSSRLAVMWRSISRLFILNVVPYLLNAHYILKCDLFSPSLRNNLKVSGAKAEKVDLHRALSHTRTK